MSGANEMRGNEAGQSDVRSQHELLCAHVLGELEGPERAEIERALAGSAELRAERARIAATVGLVRTACGATESLPAGFLGRLEDIGTPPRPWHARSWVRAAAGFALFAGGAIAVQEATRERSHGVRSEELARATDAELPLLAAAENTDGSGTVPRLELSERDLRLGQVPSSSAVDSTATPSEVLGDKLKSEASQPVAEPRPADADALLARLGYVDQVDAPARETQEGARIAELSVVDVNGLGSSGGSPTFRFDEKKGLELPASEPTAGLGQRSGDGTYRALSDSIAASTAMQNSGAAGGEAGADAAQREPWTELIGVDEQAWAELSASDSKEPGLRNELFPGDPFAGEGLPKDGASSAPATPGDGQRHLEVHPEAGAAIRDEVVVAGKPVAPPATAGGSGPTSPGASGPATPSGWQPEHELGDRLTGSDDFFLGSAQRTDEDDSSKKRGPLTPAELDLLASQRADRVLANCRRWAGERPSAMYFRFWGDNAFTLAQLDPQSTFGVDVDTASYALARRYLTDGYLPEKAQVRTEEFVNYFAPDVPAPLEDTFALHTDLAPSRFGAGHDGMSAGERWMLRVVVRGKEVSREERQPLALTFVVDVSGSMKREDRLELVKHALRLLVGELDARDSIALVAFSNEARLVLPMTRATDRGVIEAAVFGMSADGGTNAEAGLRLGYEVALSSLNQAARSRVVLLSDGVANVGQTDQDRISADVRRQREAGVFLNTVGVGMENHNDLFLEQLADKGDGLCNYIDGPAEARRALVDNFTGAFEPIARDVKVQVELDPARVYRYRLLGYENRAIADQDFRNDAVDAGEVGAGHQVTALYELELSKPPSSDDAPLATVRLRWKAPSGAGRDALEDAATERSFPVSGSQATSWEGSSAGYKRAVLVAQLAEMLRRSTHAQDDSLDELLAEATKLERELGDGNFREFVAMVEKTRQLALRSSPPYDPLAGCVDALRRNACLRAELEDLRWDRDRSVLEDLERQNRELEARIRGLMRERILLEPR